MWVTTLTLLTTEVFVTHANAPLTPEGRRRLAVLIVDRRWSLRRAAERFQCSPATAKRWADRYRARAAPDRPQLDAVAPYWIAALALGFLALPRAHELEGFDDPIPTPEPSEPRG